ncbi:Glycosaminoglycan xylosylkinase [Papilio machaon]|uniref:Glycosaminoglycan xylosylkinase n=1 Tax=Papilio machaon TaxID=76193 RepID=A0A194QTN4_PAPMA|nr:Glycosaminoglycan xylosylkinase [Papilio machaon]
MLDRRIHLRNPTAEFYSPAVLKGYRLDFNLYVPSWRGAAATIVTDPGSSVWGAVWIIERKQMYRLDEQEGVNLRWYIPINVTVTTPQGRDHIARTYRESILLPKLSEGETLPPARRPSNTYLQEHMKLDYLRNTSDIFTHSPQTGGLPIAIYEINSAILSMSLYDALRVILITGTNSKDVLYETEKWVSDESLFPHTNGAPGQILRAIQNSQIALVDNAPKGTQLKLLLLLEGKQKLYFKPKRYELDNVIKGKIYAGYDRHNSEVFAYYLAMVLNFKWIAPSVIRKIHIERDVVPKATLALNKTMLKSESGSTCIYGKCFYCKRNETVCPDQNGEIEGAAILYLDRQFKIHKSPWRRSYTTKKMEWEENNNFCKKVTATLSLKRILNLIDVAIFDFLIQNGDRHRYEVYKDQIVLLDNGKGLGNPSVDELDILAPLYQCCMLSLKTWQNLELLSGGSLSETIELLAGYQGNKLATEEHFRAVDRRLMKIYATVQYCIGKYGSTKVLKKI